MVKRPTARLGRRELKEIFKDTSRAEITAKDDSLPFEFDAVEFTWDTELGYVDYTSDMAIKIIPSQW